MDLVAQVRSVLEEWGWVKYTWHSPDGFCLLGAFEHVTGATFRVDDDSERVARSQMAADLFVEALDAVRRIRREIELHEGERGDQHWASELVTLGLFNDSEETTLEDVLLVLKRAEGAAVNSGE